VTSIIAATGVNVDRIAVNDAGSMTDSWPLCSPAWQGRLHDAEADVAAGRVQRFGTDDDFLAHLEGLDEQAGG
jgi:hypothetical protein